MPVKFEIPPAIPATQPYSLDIKAMSNAIRVGKKDWYIAASDAFDKIQAAVNVIQIVQRKASNNTFNELIITDNSGALIGWIGSRPPYVGAWFKQLYVGGKAPDSAPFFANSLGEVIIGKNGSLELQDLGGNEVGWLGVQSDAAKNITNATNTTPIVVTVATHGYENGDTVFIANVGGNTNANGYRIVQGITANTFEITDLDGVDIAGNAAYTTGGTATRYFGGGRFQTIAVGRSFTDYKIRAYADGQLKIRDALITLTDVLNNGYIELNPSTGPTAIFRNTLTGDQFKIVGGVVDIRNYLAPSTVISIDYSGFRLFNIAGDPNVSISSNFGAGQLNVHDSGGSGTIGLNGATGTVTAEYFDAAQGYRIGGVPGIDNVSVIPTGFSYTTGSAVTSVDFGAESTDSDTFVTGITYTDVTLTHTKGILTDAA